MAFKVRKVQFRRWPVSVVLHDIDPAGQPVEITQSFVGHFLPFTEEDLRAAQKAINDGLEGEEAQKAVAKLSQADTARREAAFFALLMCGWEEMFDEAGQPLAYSEEALARLCCGNDGPAVRRGLNGSILELRLGMAPAKNDVTSPAPGQPPAPGEDTAPTS